MASATAEQQKQSDACCESENGGRCRGILDQNSTSNYILQTDGTFLRSSTSEYILPAHRCWGLHPCCETLLTRLTSYGHAANERRGSDMHDEAGKCLEHHDHVALRPRGSMCWCSKRYNLQHRIYSGRIDIVRNRT